MFIFQPLTCRREIVKSALHPSGRICSTMYNDGKMLYVFGGFDPTSANYQLFQSLPHPRHKPDFLDLWGFDLSKKRWKLLADKEKLYLSDLVGDRIITAIFFENYFTIYTYASLPDHEQQGRLFGAVEYHYRNDQVFTRYNHGKHFDSAATNMISHQNFVYAIRLAGFKKTSFDVYEFDPHNLELTLFSKYDPSIEDRSYLVTAQHTLAYDGKSIFVIGGYIHLDSGGTFIPLISIPVFDFQSKTWRIMNTYGDYSQSPRFPIFPAERVDFSITQFTDLNTGDVNVVIFGGTKPAWSQAVRGAELTNDNIYRDLWKLNLRSKQWKYVGLIPSVIDGTKHCATISPYGQLCIFGGIRKAIDDVSICSSQIYSIWLCVPRLKQMCWQALLYYIPNISLLTEDQVIALGIKWDVFTSLNYT